MREESRVRCGCTKQVKNLRGDWHDNKNFNDLMVLKHKMNLHVFRKFPIELF